MINNLLDMLDEMRAIAKTGINYARSPYDLQQYTRLLEMASQQYAEITGVGTDIIMSRFSAELGYITAKVGVQCALFNDEGKILLERRRDDGLFRLPGGWVDMGETPETSIIREVMEECGLTITVDKLLGIYTRLPGEYAQPHTSIHVLYLCSVVSGELTISHESLEIGFYNPADITDWHKDQKKQVKAAQLAYNESSE